jgi:MraZ protein
MATFIGDFVCKTDSKGRVVLPSLFKKAMNAMEENRFVVRKDLYEDCLMLSPYPEWEREMNEIRSKINMYNREHNRFYRQYYRGAAEVTFDANGRLLIPKRLMEKVGIPKEIVLVGMDSKIELWNKTVYDGDGMSEVDLANMGEGILGSVSQGEKEDV